MTPAELSLPVSYKKVAIVNNVPKKTENILSTSWPVHETESDDRHFLQTKFYDDDATTATESLANAIAKANYFDEVVVCDSALRTKDADTRTITTLTKSEVAQLINELDVDFIVALENVSLRTDTKIGQAIYGMYAGELKARMAPVIRIYSPTQKATASICRLDSISWEGYGSDIQTAKESLATEDEVIKEITDYAGSSVAKSIIPSWETSERYFFTGGSVNMRDAYIYAKEEEWEKAIALWTDVYNTSKGKKKMYAAYNLALGNEMTDNIVEACDWIEKADSIAQKVEKVDSKSPQAVESPRYALITYYSTILKKRMESLGKVKIQMMRFNDNF